MLAHLHERSLKPLTTTGRPTTLACRILMRPVTPNLTEHPNGQAMDLHRSAITLKPVQCGATPKSPHPRQTISRPHCPPRDLNVLSSPLVSPRSQGLRPAAARRLCLFNHRRARAGFPLADVAPSRRRARGFSVVRIVGDGARTTRPFTAGIRRFAPCDCSDRRTPADRSIRNSNDRVWGTPNRAATAWTPEPRPGSGCPCVTRHSVTDTCERWCQR